MRGGAGCDPDPRGTLPVRPGERITIRVPGKITLIAFRNFDAKTGNSSMLDDPRPRRVAGARDLWTVRVPSRLDPRTNYLSVTVLLPRRSWVTYEIKARRAR